MKISFLYNITEGPFGGGNQFLKALKNYCIKKEIYSDKPEEANVLLLNSFPFREEYRFRQIYELKKQGKLLIHRVDGPIYQLRNKDLFIDKIIYFFNRIGGDGTIFQSYWSRQRNFDQGMKKTLYETVIYNAPDQNLFNNDNRSKFDKTRKINLIACSWSSNWRKGFQYYKYLDENLDFKKYNMTFIGNSPLEYKNIEWLFPLPSAELALYLKKSDIFITGSQSDPCSNAVLEALHCGLPVVALNDGGHPEIIKGGGTYFSKENELIECIEEVVGHYEYYQNNIDVQSFGEIAESYLNFIKGIFVQLKKMTYHPKKISRLQHQKIRIRLVRLMVKNKGFKYIYHTIKQKFKTKIKKTSGKNKTE